MFCDMLCNLCNISVPEHLFLVLNGLLIPEVVDKIGLSEQRPIPPRIDVLRAKWKAGFERVSVQIYCALERKMQPSWYPKMRISQNDNIWLRTCKNFHIKREKRRRVSKK